MRETLAPVHLRAGIGIGPVRQADAVSGANRNAFEIAHQALRLATHDRGLTRYLGTATPATSYWALSADSLTL